MSFIAEMKRRNIFRVATVYAIGSWVLLQLYDIVGPAVGFSESSIVYLLAILLAGFPAVLLFCWFFEITPQGLMLTKAVTEDASISKRTGRTIDLLIIGLLTVALGFFMFEYLTRPDQPTETISTVSSNEDPVTDESTPGPVSVSQTAVVDSGPSVAVLPFVNMSSDEENEYFADGLSEELLNVLAQVQGLRVAGRTSSFYYKGREQNLTEIGDALNVESILEGSVRKSGTKVRITAQLINAKDGFHLWSRTFDREIEDVFAIQDEIAREVSNAMQVTLLESGIRVGGSVTTNVAAHDAYLRGKRALYQRTLDEVRHAMDMFQLAHRLDPEFAPALIGVASTAMITLQNHQALSFLEANAISAEALDKAAALGFETSEYWATLGLHYSHSAIYDPAALTHAEEAYQKAIMLNQNDVHALHWYASLLSEDKPGDNRQAALDLLDKARQLDPLNRVINGNRQLILAQLGRIEEAIANYERLRRLDPHYPTYAANLSVLQMWLGDVESAVSHLDEIPADDFRRAWIAVALAAHINDAEALDQVLAQVPLDSFGFELVEELEFALRRSRPELTARAEVFLLQADYGRLAEPLIGRLIELEEYDLARRLVERTYPAMARDTPVVIPIRREVCNAYLVAIYKLGETGRAQRYAKLLLSELSPRPRVGFRAKGVNDALYHIVLGEREQAIAVFEEAAAEGWRRFYNQRIPHQPWFLEIADEPRVRAVVAIIDQHVDAVRGPVREGLRRNGLLKETFAASVSR